LLHNKVYRTIDDFGSLMHPSLLGAGILYREVKLPTNRRKKLQKV
jgi:hypothetical protein